MGAWVPIRDQNHLSESVDIEEHVTGMKATQAG